MKITSIKQQVKNPDRASIFIDGKYSFSLSLNELVSEKLKISQEVDEPELKRLRKLSDDGKLRGRALEWVLNRPRSIQELKNYLYRKKADPDLVDKFIIEFTDRGYLDEARYAAWLIEMRRRKGKSERVIQSELVSKGVDREISSNLLKEENNETDRLTQLVAKKCKLQRYKADEQKLIRYLMGQGFNYSDIKNVLDKSS